MLLLQLEAGEKLPRHLEAAGKAIASLVEEGVDAGLVRVWAYPHPGPVLAAAVVFAHLYRLGVTATFKVSVRPPAAVDYPSILLGYPGLPYKAADVEARLVYMAQVERVRGHPPPGSVYLAVDGSLAVAYTLIVEASGLGGLSPELRAASLAGLYLDGRVGRTGRISGLDRVYVERLASKGQPKPMIVTTLKVYRPLSRPLCEALRKTAVPPMPLARDGEDACRERLAAAGLGPAAGRPAARLERGELERLIDLVSGDDGLEAAEAASGLLVLEGSPLEDPREAAHALVYTLEASSSTAAIAASMVDPQVELAAALGALEARAPWIVDWAWGAELVRARGPGWLRLYSVEPQLESPSIAYMALRSLGVLDEDTVIALVREDRLLVSPLQAAMADYELPKRLVESRVAREEGFWLEVSQA
ncbi:MAG: hypothetical protein LRS49_04170 [Desulfurococcales archaeon]|nr:hypothetical protein [Desulfurococcales archaeon]